jgi:hypothetical protein
VRADPGRHHAHSECLADLDDPSPDFTDTDDCERFAGQFFAAISLPMAPLLSRLDAQVPLPMTDQRMKDELGERTGVYTARRR